MWKVLLLSPLFITACASISNTGRSPLEQPYKGPSQNWLDIENNLSRQVNFKDWSVSAVLVTKALIKAKRDQTRFPALEIESDIWYGSGEHFANIIATVICSRALNFSKPVRLYVIRPNGLDSYMEWSPF